MRRFFFAAFCCITALQLSAQGYLETSYTPSRDFLDKDRNVHGQGELWQVRGMYTHNFSTKLNDEGQPIVWAGTLSGMYARLKNEGFAAEYNPGQILNLSFNISHIRPLTRKNPRWYMIASLGAGIYSAPNDIAWRSWLVNGGLIFAYKLRDNLDVGIGAGLTNSFGVPLVMPMTFVKWTSTGKYEILIITSARIIIDPYELFLSYKSGKRGYILIDEMINYYPQPFDIPREMKDIVTFVDRHKTHQGKRGKDCGNDHHDRRKRRRRIGGGTWYAGKHLKHDAARAAGLPAGNAGRGS